MKFWEEIVNKALLGSAKLPLRASDVPEFMLEDFDLAESGENEEDFLRITSLAFQFRQSGAGSVDAKTIGHTEAEAEVKPYCSLQSIDQLKAILAEELLQFLQLWLTCCLAKQQLVQPEMIPTLLEIAERRKELQRQIIEVTGKRGQWLSGLNPIWRFSIYDDTSTIWETGTAEQRKQLLRDVRTNNPNEAMALLQATWDTEGANEKLSFLEVLKINLSSEDLPWLEGLKEKGQKVNGAILELLKSIPASAIVIEYKEVLTGIISIKTGKALLGMINRTSLEINESPVFPERIFKTGIDKLSSDKHISDHNYVLIQLIASVPPSYFNQQFQLSTETILDLFQKEKNGASYLQAFALAALRFMDTAWIKALLENCAESLNSVSVVSLIGGLDAREKDLYALRYIKDKPQEIVQLMVNNTHEWSTDLAKAILKFTANEVYNYNKTFYRPAAALIPVALLDILDSFAPAEEEKKVYWKNQSDELARLLILKKQTLQSFNA